MCSRSASPTPSPSSITCNSTCGVAAFPSRTNRRTLPATRCEWRSALPRRFPTPDGSASDRRQRAATPDMSIRTTSAGTSSLAMNSSTTMARSHAGRSVLDKCTIAAPEFEHVADDAFDALGIVQHDAQQRSLPGRVDSSRSNSPACLIADSGFRISCAMLAVRRPSAASLSCRACSCRRPRSSRKPEHRRFRALRGDEARAQMHAAGRGLAPDHLFAPWRLQSMKLCASSVE
jgi:hypothetical protein